MTPFQAENELKIIDVPPELRGMSDEEILSNSVSKGPFFTGKRKNGAARPSKRERLALKQQKELQEAEMIAAEIFAPASKPFGKQPIRAAAHRQTFIGVPLTSEKQELLRTAFTPESQSLSTYKAKEQPEQTIQSVITEAPKPASGRVLKASFGGKGKEQPKAVIVSAADLAKQKAEERAQKIRDFFKAKHPEATTMPNGEPIKRGRGRPRKNPLV